MTFNQTRSIKEAIEAGEEFKAVRLIFKQQGVKDPRFAAWSAGPIKGQAVISDWLESQKIEVTK